MSSQSSAVPCSDPTFLIIGVQKGGTTWLYQMLTQHPDIFLSLKKQINYYNLRENYSRGLDWYRQFFAASRGQTAIGEASANYLWTSPTKFEVERVGVIPNIPELVHKDYPSIKLVVSLRDPVARAVSAYLHYIRLGEISPRTGILEACSEKGILSMGFYQRHIAQWLKFFPIEQFCFLIYEEDIVDHKSKTLAGIFRFLGVDETFLPEDIDRHWNAGYGHFYTWTNHLSPRFARLFFRVFPGLRDGDFPRIKIDKGDLDQLAARYEQENGDLAALIRRDLPW